MIAKNRKIDYTALLGREHGFCLEGLPSVYRIKMRFPLVRAGNPFVTKHLAHFYARKMRVGRHGER
jgi:hypothetical protein